MKNMKNNCKKMKPSIDNQDTAPHLEKNVGKAKYMKLKREKDIEADNNMLLQKIFGILSSNKVTRHLPGPKSLNLVKRRKESRRINESNRRMVMNLMNVAPTISHENFKKHGKQTKSQSKLSSKFDRKKEHSKIIDQ